MADETQIQFNDPSVNQSSNTSFAKSVLLPSLLILVIALGGLGTGWFLAKGGTKGQVQGVTTAPGAEVKSGGREVGIKDDKTFRDNAEGTLEDGGIDGEGTHHLTRDGGPSQTAYLMSSVVDLDQFVGKKVQVWGETLGAKKAGWLMDVGRVKELE